MTREPGTAMAYSGGGYAVLQLLVEEVTGQPFPRYMDEAVLRDGGTPPSWGASMRVNPATGDAFVLLASGGGPLVTRLADTWTYWQTGIVTPAARRQWLIDLIRPTGMAVAIGAILILLWQLHSGRNLPWGTDK